MNAQELLKIQRERTAKLGVPARQIVATWQALLAATNRSSSASS